MSLNPEEKNARLLVTAPVAEAELGVKVPPPPSSSAESAAMLCNLVARVQVLERLVARLLQRAAERERP
jgi:hypothetical protein